MDNEDLRERLFDWFSNEYQRTQFEISMGAPAPGEVPFADLDPAAAPAG